ncbi:hypothetical protein VTG60DRAFT_4316 [Thermothelomyces hinnuleus]
MTCFSRDQWRNASESTLAAAIARQSGSSPLRPGVQMTPDEGTTTLGCFSGTILASRGQRILEPCSLFASGLLFLWCYLGVRIWNSNTAAVRLGHCLCSESDLFWVNGGGSRPNPFSIGVMHLKVILLEQCLFTPSFAVRLVPVACLFFFFFLDYSCGCAKRAYLDPELCIYPYPSTLALPCHTPSPHTSGNQFHFTRRHLVCEAAQLHFCSLGHELPRSD